MEDLKFYSNINFSHFRTFINVRLSNGKILTDFYVKNRDMQQFLNYTSSHLDHTKRSIVFSQALRFSRICSEKSDFLKHLEKMKSRFLFREYHKDLIEVEMKKVYAKNRNTKRSKSLKAVPFVMTHHPKQKSIN